MVAVAPRVEPATVVTPANPQTPPIRLREELRLRPADPDPDGAPAWVLHDPIAGRFFRLGPQEVEILAHVEVGDAAAVAERVRRETERPVEAEEVEEVIAFLRRHNLVVPDAKQHELKSKRVVLRASLWVGVGAFLLLVPWRGTVLAPATLKGRYQIIYTADAGRIEQWLVTNGMEVEEGDVLARLHVPDREHELEIARQRLRELQWQREAGGFHRELLNRKLVIDTELRTQLRRVRSLERTGSRLTFVAPHGGVVVDQAPDIRVGDWVPQDTPLFAILDRSESRITAYVGESDLARIAAGDRATFHPEGGAWPAFPVTVEAIDRVDLARLDELYPASLFGGKLATRRGPRDELLPVEATYRVRLSGTPPGGLPPRVVRGRVAIAGERESVGGHILQTALGLLRRKAGF